MAALQQLLLGTRQTFLALDFTSSIPAAVTITSSPVGYAPTSSGTLTGFSANAGRRTDLGILIEPARTNYKGFSQALEQTGSGGWTPSAMTVTANNIAGPEGTTIAERMLETSATGSHDIHSQAAFLVGGSGVVHCASTYVRSINGRDIVMSILSAAAGNPQVNVFFNLSGAGSATVVVVNAGFGTVTAFIEALGNSWYRGWAFFTRPAGSTSVSLYFTSVLSGTQTFSFAGNTSNGFHLWNPQVEAGATVTSAIGTSTSAAVTRAADNVGFTIPSGCTSLRYTFDDNSTQDVAVSSGSYTIPTTLNRPQIKTIVGS